MTTDPPEHQSSRAEEMWHNLINEAPYVDGGAQPWSLPQDIPWFEKDRYTRGLAFVKEYYTLHCFIIWLTSTVAAIVKPFSGTFFRDHQLYPENVWFERDLRGMKFSMSLLEHDLTDTNSQGTKVVRNIRRVHRTYARVEGNDKLLPLPDNLIPELCHLKAKEIRELFQDIPVPDVPAELTSWNPPLHFSQFAMAFASFGVCGPCFTMPAIYKHSAGNGLYDSLYSMAVGVRLLGIQDKYNLALCPDITLYGKVMDLVFIFLKEIDATGYFFLEPSLKVIKKTGITLNVLLYFTLEQAGKDSRKIWRRMNVLEKMMTGFINWGLIFYLKFRPFRILMNIMCKIFFKLLYFMYLKPSKDSRHVRKVNGMCSFYKAKVG